jgi:nucleoside-diphosphate-sugar epimerase
MIAHPRRALVTGATGFIGSHLLDHLKLAGWQVAVLSRPAAADLLGTNPSVSKVYVYTGTTQEAVNAVAEFKPDTVFHLGSLFLATHNSSQVEPLITSNVLFGTQLLEAMKAANVTALVNTGSSWQNYSCDAYRPVNLYAATKQAFEDVLGYYTDAAGVRAITLRLYDSYGPSDTRRKLLRLLLDCLKTGKPLGMSPGEQVLDLVHVDDICRAFLQAAALVEQQQPGNSIYAVSGGQRRTLQQVVATLAEAAGRPLPVQFGALPYRAREVMTPWVGRTVPGWEPRIDLLTGFKMLLATEPGLLDSPTTFGPGLSDPDSDET